jgi:hypothetical protein
MNTLVQSPKQKVINYDASGQQRSLEVPGVVNAVGVGIQATVTDDYVVYLRLLTAGFTLKKARVNGGAFFPMPWIHKNCFTDCDTCFKNGNYQPILNAHCHDSAFQLELHFQSDSNPSQWGKTTHNITPDCNYPGQVECVG